MDSSAARASIATGCGYLSLVGDVGQQLVDTTCLLHQGVMHVSQEGLGKLLLLIDLIHLLVAPHNLLFILHGILRLPG